MNIIRFLNHSNLFVALGAACLTAETLLVNDFLFNPFSIAQSFFLVWCAYLFLKRDDGHSQKGMIYTSVTGLLLTGYFTSHWLLIIPLVLVAFYKTEWMKEAGVNLKFSLRSIGWLKPMVIASCWCLVTTLIPMINSSAELEKNEILFSLQNFIFILSLALAGDIRDEKLDRDAIKTLPGIFRPGKLLIPVVLLVVLSVFILFLSIGTAVTVPICIVLISILAIVMIRLTNWNWHFQTFILDALLPIRLIIFLLIMK